MKLGRGLAAAVFVMLISVCVVPVLAAETPSAKTYPAANAKARVCILAYETEFKRNLTAALALDLNANGITVIADSVKNHRNYRAADYDAVIVLSGMRMGGVLTEAADFIKANDYAPNIIYVFTHKIEGSPYGRKGNVLDSNRIDAISSASVSKTEAAFGAVEKQIFDSATKLIAAARKA